MNEGVICQGSVLLEDVTTAWGPEARLGEMQARTQAMGTCCMRELPAAHFVEAVSAPCSCA